MNKKYKHITHEDIINYYRDKYEWSKSFYKNVLASLRGGAPILIVSQDLEHTALALAHNWIIYNTNFMNKSFSTKSPVVIIDTDLVPKTWYYISFM